MTLLAVLAVVVLGASSSDAEASPTWGWPLVGPVITPFSQGADPYASGDHRGIDIEAARGTTVVSPVAGKVRWVGTLGAGGKMVSVTARSDGYVLSFLHLSEIAVTRGREIRVGDSIGLSGDSGNLRGKPAHLHFGVRTPTSDSQKLRYVDPLQFLSPAGSIAAPGTAIKPRPRRARKPSRVGKIVTPRVQPKLAQEPPALQPVEETSVRPAAPAKVRKSPVRRSAESKLPKRSSAIEPVSISELPEQHSTEAGETLGSGPEKQQRFHGAVLPFVALATVIAFAAVVAWWRRRFTGPPLMPAQPPSVTRLRSVDDPRDVPARQVL